MNAIERSLLHPLILKALLPNLAVATWPETILSEVTRSGFRIQQQHGPLRMLSMEELKQQLAALITLGKIELIAIAPDAPAMGYKLAEKGLTEAEAAYYA